MNRQQQDLPNEMWVDIFKHVDLRDLVALSRTSQRFRALSLYTAKKKHTARWNVCPKQVRKHSKSFALWFSRVPRLGLKLESLLWSDFPTAPLSVRDIRNAQRMINTGDLPQDFIQRKANFLKHSLEQMTPPTLPMLSTTAAMARAGVIKSLDNLLLQEINTASIPARNMAALVSVVSGEITLTHVTGNLRTILSHLHCRRLKMTDMTLNPSATQLLLSYAGSSTMQLFITDNVWADTSVLKQHGLARLSRHCKNKKLTLISMFTVLLIVLRKKK